MKSKLLALKKNEEFKSLLKSKKTTNKYVTIFFGHLNNKNRNNLNISFVTKKKLEMLLTEIKLKEDLEI